MAKTMLSNLAAIAQNTSSSRIQMIDIDELHDSPDNFFRMERIDELADAILGQGGVKDNLIVRPLEPSGYEIISGHRRKSAVQFLLDHGASISRLLPCLVQRYADDDSRIMDMILMNVSARQLSDQELWQSYERIDQILQDQKSAIGKKFGRVREKLADMLGISSSQVSKLQHIKSSAEPEVQEAIADGTLSINTANEIAKLNPDSQQEIVKDGLSTVTPKKIREVSKKQKVDTPVNVAHESDADTDYGMKVDTPVNEAHESDADTDYGMKVDTPVNEAHESDAGIDSDMKVDTPVNENSAMPNAVKDFMYYAMMPKEERDRIFDSGCFNQIALGYLTLTLQDMEMDKVAIQKAQRVMNGLFELAKAADARIAYEES